MYRVAISAGHHEKAQGADRKGITEFSETVPWRDQLIESIEAVAKTRRLELEAIKIESGFLSTKVRHINQAEVDLAIEIHFNAANTDKPRGCEILYCPGSDAGMAAGIAMQLQLAKAMDTKSRGVKPGWYRMDRPGVIDFYGDEDGDEMPDYFLRKTKCVALIIEPEFLFWIERIREKREAGCFVIAKAIAGFAAQKKADNAPAPEPDEVLREIGEAKDG